MNQVKELPISAEYLQTLLQLGERDHQAEEVFQAYNLIGQNRSLLDPHEQVRIIRNHDWNNFFMLVKKQRLQFRQINPNTWKKQSVQTAIEIIIGNLQTPENCSRHRIINIQTDGGKYQLTLQLNIEHQKIHTPIMNPNTFFERGVRTGILIYHPRLPQEVTVFHQDQAQLPIDPDTDYCWLVIPTS